jgi:hypothetical protein
MPATFSLSRTNDLERVMKAVMIGVDPHKGSHTAVVISAAEEPLGEIRVRASAAQAGKLTGWAAAWPERTWAVEGAAGLGRLLDWQLVAAGERVLDVQPKLASRVRLLQAPQRQLFGQATPGPGTSLRPAPRYGHAAEAGLEENPASHLTPTTKRTRYVRSFGRYNTRDCRHIPDAANRTHTQQRKLRGRESCAAEKAADLCGGRVLRGGMKQRRPV